VLLVNARNVLLRGGTPRPSLSMLIFAISGELIVEALTRIQNQRVLQIVWWRATVVLRDLRVGPQEWDSTTARSETRDAVSCEGRSCSCTALVTRQYSHDARCPSLRCFDDDWIGDAECFGLLSCFVKRGADRNDLTFVLRQGYPSIQWGVQQGIGAPLGLLHFNKILIARDNACKTLCLGRKQGETY
jgi:hypothetical protein